MDNIINNVRSSTGCSKRAVILTIDVEDWFQVENLKGSVPFETWGSCDLRVEKNVHVLLDLLDSVKTNGTGETKKTGATFFILGWIADRLPHLVREIADRGHEVASHGYFHHLCSRMSDDELLSDLKKSKALLEDITGSPILGYRAPSFDIRMETLSLIESAGYNYDSSYNSFSGHGRYGKVDFTSFEKQGLAIRVSKSFYELPVSNLSLGGRIIPWGGGGYFRMIPSALFHVGVRKIILKEGAYLFYTHPWEFDPSQPRVNDIPLTFKFRHYINLDKTEGKLHRFINTFKSSEFISCSDYLKRRSQR